MNQQKNNNDEPKSSGSSSSSPSGNQKLLVGLIAGLMLGLIIAFYFLGYFPITSTFILNFLIALFIIFTFGILIFTWFKERILKKYLGPDFELIQTKDATKGIYETISQEYIGKLLDKFPKQIQQQGRAAAPQLLKMAIWSFTRTWALRLIFSILVAIGGLLGAILLYNQNVLTTDQNKKIDIQNNLIEAERRSSLVFLMSNVMDKVDDEINQQKKILDELGLNSRDTTFELSSSLKGRIIALSRAFKPYKILDTETDTLNNKLVSPERGQLFISLMASKLDSATQNYFVSQGDFSNTMIGKISLDSSYLSNARLRGADLFGADLFGADFFGADLFGADLTGTYLSRAYLSGADLTGSYLIGADLTETSLSGADLEEADFSEADFFEAQNLTKQQLAKAKSLYLCEGLPTEIERDLKKEKPCLFEEGGCD